MKNRRRQGATLGLVAVCVLVIIVVGIGCFFLAKIFGGGREVANATDAGALNIAKNTMKRNGDPLVSVDASAYPNFVDCSDPPNTQITLLTYNRCVAQALLVAMNAQAETAMGATAANGAANSVLNELNKLGSVLASKLEDSAMTSYFDNVKNDTRMWGSNDLAAVKPTYVTAFMKPKESTNVYFTPSELAGLTLPGNWKSIGTDKTPDPTTGAFGNVYLSGYVNLSVPGVGNIIGVPVFPQQNPHLVSKADFDSAPAAPGPSVPPNSFMVSSRATDTKSGNFGGAVAAAIVGAVKQVNGGGGKYDFAAAIPGGYIELANLPGVQLPAGYRGFDNADNIFNNELYTGPGIDIAPVAGGGAAFSSTDMTATGAWAAYNNSSATDASGDGKNSGTFVADTTNNNPTKNANLYPPSIGHPLSAMKVTNSTSAAGTTPATDSDLRTIAAQGTNCKTMLDQTNDLTGTCLNFLQAMENTYSPGPSGTAGPDTSTIYSSVDLVKGEVISAFQSGGRSVQINAPGGTSGLGVYPNMGSTNPTPYYTAPIQRTGTINQLLDQVVSEPKDSNAQPPGCTKAAILAQMTQRCYEIKPDAAAGDVAAMWNQQLPMGETLYIYLPGGDPTQKLTISPTPPSTRLNTVPDGAATGSWNLNCSSFYDLNNSFVNVEKTSIPADDNLHEQMYRNYGPKGGDPANGGQGGLSGKDHAQWILSSGFQNLLGKLQFSNEATGSEHFSRPN